MHDVNDKKSALLNIDIQDPWAEGSPEITSAIEVFTNKARAVMPIIWPCIHYIDIKESFRTYQLPMLSFLFNARAEKAPALKPFDQDWIQCKPSGDAFWGTKLDQLLTAYGIKRLYLTGFMTSQCVEGTAETAAKSYETILLSDLTSNGKDIPADDRALARFEDINVKVMDSCALKF